jgi:predicted transcriptional regulator
MAFDYTCKRIRMSTPIDISDAESVVMDVLWERHPRTAEEVVAALAGRQDWQEATIKTLLNRLLGKGALRAERDGRRYLYSPLLEREAWLSRQSESLLARLFDGRVAPLVAHFSRQRKLSAQDIAELKQLIEGLDDGQ